MNIGALRIKGSLLYGALFSLIITQVAAQSYSDHEKQLKEGLDRLENQLKPLQQRRDTFLQNNSSKHTEPNKNSEEVSICFDIHDIELEGATLLSDTELDIALLPYLGRCLSLSAINELVEAVSNFYMEQGYVTSRAYIVPQDLSDGRLSLLVVEGVIEDIVSGDGSLSDVAIGLSMPSGAGNKLNLRDIEQGLENLNLLGSNNVSVNLNPGEIQGGTQVVLSNQSSPWWRGSLGISNSGSESTGEYILDGNLVLDDAIGFNDALTFTASTNVGYHQLPQAESRSLSAGISIPYGYWLFSFNNSYYDYERSVIGNTINFLTHGSSFNSSINARNTVYRGQSDKFNIELSFTRKESKNYIEDVFLDTSSRTIYVWSLQGDYIKYLSQGQISAGINIDHSVPWFEAKTELAEAEDDFQFTKYELNVNYARQFDLFGRGITYRASLDYLHSPKVIIASEGVAVGGRYSVRGFSRGGLFGYRGGYVRNDISIPFDVNWFSSGKLLAQWGIDIGGSNLPEYEQYKSSWVAGSMLSLTYAIQSVVINVSYAKALRTPEFLEPNQQEIDFYIRINF